MKMKFEIRENGSLISKFEEEVVKGINTLMKDIADYMVDKNKEDDPWASPCTSTKEIHDSLMRGIPYYFGGRMWVMRGMRVVEYGKMMGMTVDECVDFATGPYSEGHARENIDKLMVNRYMLLGKKSFREVDRMYNDAYAEDEDIGTIYDWLEERAMPDDFKAMKA